jgi:MtN3 and saliva related transmembrane protein
MSSIQVLGYIAGFCTTFAGIPQIVHVMKTKSTHDLSYVSIGFSAAGVIMWTIYGFYIQNAPIIVFNIISTVVYVWLIGFKIWNERYVENVPLYQRKENMSI